MVESSVQTHFSPESVADELPAYRPVRVTVFVALALGLLSACTIFSKVFLPLPVLTLIVAGIALRPSPGGVPVGRPAAYAGAVLAVFFGSWGWFQETTREAALRQDASRSAQYWLETLQQGDAERALELAHMPAMRQSEKMSLKMYYQRNETAQEKLQTFLDRPLVSMILAKGESLRWEAVEPPVVSQQTTADRVTVRLKETTGMVGGMVQIEMLRQPASPTESAGGEWFVSDFQLSPSGS